MNSKKILFKNNKLNNNNNNLSSISISNKSNSFISNDISYFNEKYKNSNKNSNIFDEFEEEKILNKIPIPISYSRIEKSNFDKNNENIVKITSNEYDFKLILDDLNKYENNFSLYNLKILEEKIKIYESIYNENEKNFIQKKEELNKLKNYDNSFNLDLNENLNNNFNVWKKFLFKKIIFSFRKNIKINKFTKKIYLKNIIIIKKKIYRGFITNLLIQKFKKISYKNKIKQYLLNLKLINLYKKIKRKKSKKIFILLKNNMKYNFIHKKYELYSKKLLFNYMKQIKKFKKIKFFIF